MSPGFCPLVSAWINEGPQLDRINRMNRIMFSAFPPARHLPAMLRNARRAGREPLRPALQPSGVRRTGEAGGEERQKDEKILAIL